ncbi:MAG TPA: hypothetical protein DCS93_14675 [Microscillaceae bacterium]|nr:hypothetical protein [Microscillaceae bacterium]
MKYLFTYCFLCVLFVTLNTHFVQAQATNVSDLKPLVRKGKEVVCPFGKADGKHHHIPPPAEFLKRYGSRTQAKKSNIKVTYNGFTPQAQAAFQFAVEIWETVLASPDTIRVVANWRTLDPGVLGSAGATTYRANFKNAPLRNVWYPIALAERIAGESLNGNSPDISANFSSSINWYFGTDGNPPSDEFDLVSIVLHELGHGLGFVALRNYDENQGTYTYGSGGFPDIYNYRMVDGSGNFLRDTTVYTNGSTQLGTAVTNSNLFFNGPTTNTAASSTVGSKLHAPGTFEPGSSIAHLDNIYDNTPNGLMTPSAGPGEAVHDPGPVATAMLNDMGWRTTRLTVLDTIKSTETPAANYPVKFAINSDTTYQASAVKFYYSLDSMKTKIELTPTGTGTANEFSVTIPSVTDGSTVAYYAEVIDDAGRVIQSPSQATDFKVFFFFFVGVDNVAPTLTHAPITDLISSADTAAFSAESTDIFGLSSIQVEYSINGVAQTPIDMIVGTGFDVNRYTGVMRFTAGQLNNGDSITYRIVAKDNSNAKNTTILPATGTYKIDIKGSKAAQAKYQTDFNDVTTASDDFVGNNFSIRLESGFNDGAIHSDHPYLDGSGTGDESNYTYQLRIPIVVAANRDDAWMRFDEIVLVEPGEPGSLFGSADFYDYFVAEGSTDDGKTWVRLGNGYDATDDTDWNTLYNSTLSGNVSTGTGTPSLFKPRFYNLRDIFNSGTTVVLRFRLFADQAANGWGVAIDNLNIQDGVVGIEEFIEVNNTNIKMFPNPSNGQFNIQATFKKQVGTLPVSITNLNGQKVYSTTFDNVGKQFSGQIAPNQLAPGVYFVNVHLGKYQLTKRIVIKKD